MTSSVIYATVDEFKALPSIGSVDEDPVAALMLEAASRAVDNICNREDGFQADETAVERSFAGLGEVYLRIRDFIEVTAVSVRPSTTQDYIAVTSDFIRPFSGDVKTPNFYRLPFTGIILLRNAPVKFFTDGNIGEGVNDIIRIDTVKVTAKWGYSVETPAIIKTATLAQAARWFKRGEVFWADATGNDELGSLNYRKVVDPDIKAMLHLGGMVRPAI